MQNAAKAKLELAQPKSKDGTPSPTLKRRQELQMKLNEIRKEQAGGKAGRTNTFDQIKKLDEQLKSRIAEQRTARSRVAFKNVDEVDREIEHLEKQVNGGMMKLVDEKKALAEISALRKQRKNFAGFEDSQKGIDDVKSKIKALRDQLDDPAAKARSDEYNKIQTELDAIKAEQDEVFKNIHGLRAQREELYKESQAKYQVMRALEDNHWKSKKAYQAFEYEQRQKVRERIKVEQEQYNLQKKRERAEKVLTEASEPAYLDEIRRAQSLIHYLDPSTATEAKPLLAPSGLSAEAQRTVDDSGIKGMKVVKKEEEDYFSGTGGKKGKKGRKGPASPAAPAPGKFVLPPSVMEDCSSMGIEPPMSATDIPAVLEKVKEKLAFWRADQKAQTEKVCHRP
jgi:chromosome segregation ATPase